MPDNKNPPGEPAPAPDVAKLGEVRKGLEELADRYRKSASWHLVFGMSGLIGGLALAVVLPAIFLIVDIGVERLRDDFGQHPVQETVADAQIDSITARRDELQIKMDNLVAQASANRFGTIIFSPTSTAPANLDNSAWGRGLNCTLPEIPGNTFYPTTGESKLFMFSATRGDASQVAATVFLEGPGGGDCLSRKLDFPQRPDFESELSVREIVEVEGYSVILGNSKRLKDGVSGGRIIVCGHELSDDGVLPCWEPGLPAGVAQDDLRFSGDTVFRRGLGIVTGLSSYGSNAVIGIAEGDLKSSEPISLSVTKVSMATGRVDGILQTDGGVFLTGPANSGGGLTIARIPDDALSNGLVLELMGDPVPVPDELGSGVQVRDAVTTARGELLVLVKGSESGLFGIAAAGGETGLALQGRGVALARSEDGKIGTGSSGGPDGRVYIAFDAGSGPGDSDRRFTAANLTSVLAVLSPKSVPIVASVEGQQLIADVPPWGSDGVLVPVRDVALHEQAKPVNTELRVSIESLFGLSNLKKTLSDSVQELKDANAKVQRQEVEVSVWITIAARLVVITLIFYFVQLQVHLYRYDSRLSGHYRARVLALDYLIATGIPLNQTGLESLYAAIVALDPRDISGKDTPGPPTDKMLETLREMFKARQAGGGGS